VAESSAKYAKLIVGPGVYICDRWILGAVGLSTSGRASDDENLRPLSPTAAASCSFCGKSRAAVHVLVGTAEAH
jgi:hypothetical protein